jgi:hypothetical protein
MLMLKMGRTRPLREPRHGPQAGKSGYPGSQNANSSPRAQGALGLGFQAKPKRQGRSAVGPQSLQAGLARGADRVVDAPTSLYASATVMT